MPLARLAQDIGTSRERLGRLEGGEEEVSVVDVFLASLNLGVSVAALFKGLNDGSRVPLTPAIGGMSPMLEFSHASVGARVRLAREMRNVSRRRLAEAAGMAEAHLRQIEGGEVEAVASELYELSLLLGVDVSFFFDGIEGTFRRQRRDPSADAGAGVTHALGERVH